MKRIIASFAAMAAAAVMAPTAANADTFTPSGSLVVFSGTLDVSQSIVSTTCASTFAVSVDGTGNYAGVVAATFTGTSLCDGLVPSGYIWAIDAIDQSPVATTQELLIAGIHIKTSAGYCNGNLEGNWLPAGNGAIDFDNAALAGKIKLGLIEVNAPCSVDGTLTANVPVTITS